MTSPPDGKPESEKDDIVRHNLAPELPKKVAPKRLARVQSKFAAETQAWHARLYRGLYWPGYQTAIASLSHDDIALATAFLAGKVSQKKCPPSDWAQRETDRKNVHRRRFLIFEKIAGAIATAVMGVIFGPLGGAATNAIHRGKVALISKVWKQKVVRDPAVKLLLNELKPTGPYQYTGFQFYLRPYGNMLVEELGCQSDLATRLFLHGRMLRALDVLVASAPGATSREGLYDYVSGFGALKGSIFPPRGPQFDGRPPTAQEDAKLDVLMRSPLVEAALAPTPIPTSATMAVAPVTAVAATRAGVRSWLLLGGAALGAALLLSRGKGHRDVPTSAR